ncbi:MAG: TRAP transporter small permease [Anaerovoracaceae bacterium]|jgi:TRAP-type C4-dicarboxylate transport system permease small subunit
MRSKIINRLNALEDIVLVSMFAAMVGIIFFQVIMRYVFNNSLPWSEELGKFLFVWLSWLGISIGHRRREHIKITMLVDKVPYTLQKVFEAVTELVLIIICAVVIYYGVLMIGIQINIPYAGIKISTAWGYLSLVLGCFIFILRAGVYFVQAIKSIKQKDIVL